MIRRWCYEHSFTIACVVGFVLSSIGFVAAAPGHWYDFFNMLQGCFVSGAVLAQFGRLFWEKDSDPTKPPAP